MTELDDDLKRERSGLSISRIFLGLLPVAIIVFVFILRSDPEGLDGQNLAGAWSTTISVPTTQKTTTIKTIELNLGTDRNCTYFVSTGDDTKEFTGTWSVKSKNLCIEFKGKKAESHFGAGSVMWPIESLDGDKMKLTTPDGAGTWKRLPRK